MATDALTSTDITSGTPELATPELVSGRPLLGESYSSGGAKLATEYTAGDNVDIGVTLLRNNRPDVSAGWESVYASIKEFRDEAAQELAGPWECFKSHPDAEWDQEAFVVVPFQGADTVSLIPGDYWLEVTATIGLGELTYHGKLKIRSGVITDVL